MKSRIFILLVFLCLTSVVHADPAPASPEPTDPQSYAVAKDIVKSFDLKMQLHTMLDSMSRMMLPTLTEANPGQSEKIEKIIAAAVEKNMTTHMDEMESNKAKVYAEIFSYEELKQLRDFYKSPIGQKMIKTTPEMMKRSLTLDQGVMVTTIKDASHDIIEQMKKDGLKVPKELGV